MLKLFKKIRQRLLTENKFSKYLIYAIGEIILVVIGILIALQINNWNERNKLRSQEIEILQDMQIELESNLKMVKEGINYNLRTNESIDILLDHLENNKPHHDSLNFHFGRITLSFSGELPSVSFETLKAKGIDLISNKRLRQKIVSFIHWNNKTLTSDSEVYFEILKDAIKNIFNTRFESVLDFQDADESIEMVPNNYESLKNDKEFIYFLKTLRGTLYWNLILGQNDYVSEGTNLVNIINDEIP